MAFTRNRPTASELLSDSQGLIRDNFNSSDDVFGIDHYQFSDTTANKGYHKITHGTVLDNLGNTRSRAGVGATTTNFPVAISGIEQTFAANYTPDTTGASTDTQLFAFTGNGGLSQLTGNLASNDGWCWVGGILLQWGNVILGSQFGTVTFKDRVPGAIPFPNNCFSVTTTVNRTTAALTGAVTVSVINNGSLPSTTQFGWFLTGSSGAFTPTGFFWLAIGN